MVKFVELSEERCGEIALAVLRSKAIRHSDWDEWALAPILGQGRRILGNLSKKMELPISDLEHFRDIILGVVEDDLSEEEKEELAWKIISNHVEIYPDTFQRDFPTTGSALKTRREIGNVAKGTDVKYGEMISFFYLLYIRSVAGCLGIKNTA